MNQGESKSTPERRETCTWTYQEADDFWEGDCGAAWQFENGEDDVGTVHYCHNCGGRAIPVRPNPEEQ